MLCTSGGSTPLFVRRNTSLIAGTALVLGLTCGVSYQAMAQCALTGLAYNCVGTQGITVGTGPSTPLNTSVTVSDGGNILVTNGNAISAGNGATITLGSSTVPPGGSALNAPVVVQTTTTNPGATQGFYHDGDNTIDVGSNSQVVINANASVISTGTQKFAEAINPYGAGDTITNYGLVAVSGNVGVAIWFQNSGVGASSPVNTIDNYGTITAGGSTTEAVGANGNVGIDVINESGGVINGDLDLVGGNDNVTQYDGSVITGSIDGGGGINTMTLTGSGADTTSGALVNFNTLTKSGTGVWTLTGALGSYTDATLATATPLAAEVAAGTLVLTGNNAAFDGTMLVDEGATLSGAAASIVPVVTDNGLVQFNQPVDGTYGGVIDGTGGVQKIGVGTLTLAPGNAYNGGTFLDEGIVNVSADNALGAASGGLNFDGGTLQFGAGFDLAATRPIFLDGTVGPYAGGGTIDTNGFDSTIAQDISGDGNLTKTGAGILTLNGVNGFTGNTDVAAGTVILGDAADPSAALAGSATVAGGAVLGGYGSVGGNVDDIGTLAAGDAALPGGPAGNFTVAGTLTDAGLVQLGGTTTGNTLTVGSFTGAGGAVALHTYLAGDNAPTDRLIIDGGTVTGTTQLQITNAGGPGAQTVNGIEVVTAEAGATTQENSFTLDGTSVRAGAYDYRLFQGLPGHSNDNFYLRSSFDTPAPPPPSPPAPPVAPPVVPVMPVVAMPILGPELSAYGVATPAAQQLGLDDLGTLYDRIGDETINSDPGSTAYRASAAWGRAFGIYTGAAYGGVAGARSSGSEAGAQLGVDLYRHTADDGGRNFAGAYFSYANAQLGTSGLVTNPASTAYVQEKTGSVRLNGYTGGMYYTHFGPSGRYVDTVVQGTSYTGQAESTRTGIALNGFGLAASLEAGDPLALAAQLYLEPQAQLIWQGVWFNRTSDSYGAVQPGQGSTLYGRVGAQLNAATYLGNWQVRPYARANLWSALTGNTSSVTYAGTDTVATKADAAWMQAGLGVTARPAASTVSLYAHVDGIIGLKTSNTNRYGVDGAAGVKIDW